jgi:hypothetical protein
MSIFQSLREMSPYRLLFLGALAVVVLTQLVAMVMVTQSQVRKAEAHYAQERTAAAIATQEKNAAVAARKPANDGVMNVGYVVSR